MNPFRTLIQIGGFLVLAAGFLEAGATIYDEKKVTIDFTSTNAAKQCTWEPADRYGITAEGLGWDRSPDGPELNGGSILMHPVAIGFYWRTATSTHVNVELKPGPREFRTAEGKPYWRSAGRMFARFSPDLAHWSSWQSLAAESRSNRVFHGVLAVPGRERNAYEKLRIEHQNDAIGSNEEATVRSIVKNDPEFFAKHLPFIGYIQILFEGEFVAGDRFKELNAVFSYSVGGMHSPPTDPAERSRFEKEMLSTPWRFTGAPKPD